MRFLATSFAIFVLLGVPNATQTSSSSTPKLVRRHQSHIDHPPYTSIYLMVDQVDYSDGPLKMFNPDGTLAFKFDKATRYPYNDLSYVSLLSPHGQMLLNLESDDDVCGFKTHYEETGSPGAGNRQFVIDPRGFKADRWKFRLIAPSGEKLSYVFKRNLWNKGGKIYLKKEEKDVFVAKLQVQIRWESWLAPGSTGRSTFTLSLTSDAPELESVMLMGLVLVRAYSCGI